MPWGPLPVDTREQQQAFLPSRPQGVFGEVTERPKVQHWKCCVPYPGTAGSNPALSAIV